MSQVGEPSAPSSIPQHEPAPPLRACPCCGLVQRTPAPPAGFCARCLRCSTRLESTRRGRGGNGLTFACALAGLILYPMAITLPILRLERLGRLNEASVWSGTVGLMSQGEWVIGGIVFACSVVLPAGKLLGLIALTRPAHGRTRLRERRVRARTYRWIEWTGRFGMLDVLLLAILVAWMKFDGLVEVDIGPAAFTFTSMVALSLIASASFDPHSLWNETLIANATEGT